MQTSGRQKNVKRPSLRHLFLRFVAELTLFSLASFSFAGAFPARPTEAEARKSGWDPVPEFPGALVRGSAAFAVGRYAYVVSGIRDDGLMSLQVWRYDSVARQWSRKRSFPGAGRLDSTGFSLNGRGYVGLGSDNQRILSDFWEYDPAGDTWVRKRDFPGGARLLATPLIVGERVFVVAGYGESANLQDVWEYLPQNDEWTRKTDFPGAARGGATGFAVGAFGYLGAGTVSGEGYTPVKDFWEYAPQTDQWRRVADLPGAARGYALGFSAGGRGYVCAGLLSINSTGTELVLARDLWEYAPQANAWTRRADLPGAGRSMAVAFSVDDWGYVGSGNDEEVINLTDYWRFTSLLAGDLDRSSRVDAADLGVTSLFLASLVEPESPPFTAPSWGADVNGDGVVNAADRSLLAEWLAGSAAVLPQGR